MNTEVTERKRRVNHSPKFIRRKSNFKSTINLLITISHNPFSFFKTGMKGIAKDLSEMVCQVAGHRWKYKDYTNWMKEDGNLYDFNASRYCPTCKKHGYYSQGRWMDTNIKNQKYDIIHDECYTNAPPYLKKSRSRIKQVDSDHSLRPVSELMKAS